MTDQQQPSPTLASKAALGHHTGRRPPSPSGLDAVMICARTSTVGALRGRRLFGLLILVGLPVLIQAVVLAVGRGRTVGFENFVGVVQNIYLAMAMPLVSIFLGTAALGDEWDSGTAHHVVGLALPRWAIACGRWISSCARTLALVLPSVVCFYILALVPFEGALLHYIGDLAWIVAGTVLLALGYVSTFLFFGIALRHSIMTSFMFMIVFEWVLPNVTGLAYLSIGFHVRNLLWQLTGHETFHSWTFDRFVEDPTPVAMTWSLLAVGIWVVVFLGLTTWKLHSRETGGSSASPEVSGSAGA